MRTGLVPSNEWKRATVGEAWQPGETINLGIGQGYITVTPLQFDLTHAVMLEQMKDWQFRLA